MRKISAFFFALFVLCSFAGCSAPTEDSGKLKIVCTIFPAYDWTREVLGEKAEYAELTMLLASGVDMHSFQPTAADMVKIADCDLLVYVGGESDAWIGDFLKTNDIKHTVNMLEVLGEGVKTEEITEGMEAEEGEPEADEHVWLSLRNACALVGEIAQKAGEADPQNAQVYADNAQSYCERLSELDEKYAEAAQKLSGKALLFGDRFPFRYLADDYGLAYYAAFPGCSAETEASFETVIFLAEKADELGLPYILQTESPQGNIAEAIIASTSGKPGILTLHSMQSVTLSEAENGTSYLSIAESNLRVLEEFGKDE